MRAKLVPIVCAMLALSACEQADRNSEGNGPGTADGAGARTDPPVQDQPAQDPPAQNQSAAEQPAPQQ